MGENISDLAAAKLRSSGITVEQARHAGILTLSQDQTRKLYASAPRSPSLKLRYLDPSGKPSALYRLRVLQPAPGFNLAKPQRYYQPPDTLPGVYFPKVKGVNWMELLSNPDHPLLVTEGELKALSATIHGIPTLGLGGVWNWKSAKSGIGFLDDLEAINWEYRAVYICYDSDAATKPEVMRAQIALSLKLLEHGAQIYDAGMPDVSGFDKVGLDDYIVAKGVKALRTFIGACAPLKHTQALHDFNSRFLYVRNMDVVIEQRTGALHSGANFVSRIAANEKYEIQVFDKAGNPRMESKPTAKNWIEWIHRAEVLSLDYEPGEPRIIESGPRYNTWSGWGCEPKKGPVNLWHDLMDFIFRDTEVEAKKWFTQWCAYPLQHPGAKLFTAVAVWSTGTGVGKTLLGETLLYIYGRGNGGNGSLITQNDLESSFNDWLDSKQFVLGDEVTGNESRKHADQLKGLLTGTTISINKKFQPRYDLPNRVNFYFTSNHPDAFFLEQQDRRFLVVQAPSQAMDQAFYDQYDKWLHGEGPANLFHYLKQVSLDGFNPKAQAPMTMAKQLMIEDNKSDVGEWVMRLKRDPLNVLPMINGNAPREFFSNHELLGFYDPQGIKRVSANGLGREMKRAGFRYVCGGMPVVSDTHPQARYYAVLNESKWSRAKRTEAKIHLEEHRFGGKEKF